MRLLLLIILLLFAFHVSANNGLEALGKGYMKLLICFIWLSASIITLYIFIRRVLIHKKAIYRYLVYASFTSLSILYYLVFSMFYKVEGSLIFDNSVAAYYKSEAKSRFTFLIVIGALLALGIIVFMLVDRKISKRNK